MNVSAEGKIRAPFRMYVKIERIVSKQDRVCVGLLYAEIINHNRQPKGFPALFVLPDPAVVFRGIAKPAKAYLAFSPRYISKIIVKTYRPIAFQSLCHPVELVRAEIGKLVIAVDLVTGTRHNYDIGLFRGYFFQQRSVSAAENLIVQVGKL